MAELSPLSIIITADADDLKAELAAARVALDKFERGAVTSTKNTKAFGGALGALGNVSNSTGMNTITVVRADPRIGAQTWRAP